MKFTEKPRSILSLIDQVTPDTEGFIAAGQEPDCEETAFTVQGEEVLCNGSAE